LPRFTDRIEIAIFYTALLVVMLAPVPLGSFRPRFWFGLESVVFALFAGFCLVKSVAGQPGVLRDYKIFFFVLLAWMMLPLIQIVPVPDALLGVLSSKAHGISQLAGPDDDLFTISLQTFTTAGEFLKRLMYVCMLVMVLYLLRRRSQAGAAVILIAVFGLLQSFYAFAEYAADPATILRGTYTNRNHFALYIAVCLSLMIGLYLSVLDYSGRRGPYPWLSGQSLAVFGLILVFVTILMFTQSKGGVVAFTAGTVLTWLLLREKKERGQSGTGDTVFLLVAGSAILSMILVGASNLYSRFSLEKITYDERWLQWGDSLRLARDYWLTGSGAGTYQFVFPAYKSAAYRPLLYHHAHNDYIETLTNEGFFGLFLLAGIFVTWLVVMRRLYQARRNPWIKGIVFGIYLAVTTIMFHALVDFNLQVPANTLTLFALMGLGFATVRIDKKIRYGSTS